MTCSHTECSHLRMFTLEGFWPMLKGSFWSVAKNLRSLTGMFTFEDVHFEEFYSTQSIHDLCKNFEKLLQYVRRQAFFLVQKRIGNKIPEPPLNHYAKTVLFDFGNFIILFLSLLHFKTFNIQSNFNSQSIKIITRHIKRIRSAPTKPNQSSSY
ncbi:hypothetical protein BpHYR1_049131 [Brachionus plicatilis]|uniref:Uncharacterized protein n=1 Tax=Brachionus plicatilis TaxID=10195 RepID=A0A3M7SK36_BRAPC|nr:hypothetical protein BpHYR1_049131 [Brachionus plicatilis]